MAFQISRKICAIFRVRNEVKDLDYSGLFDQTTPTALTGYSKSTIEDGMLTAHGSNGNIQPLIAVDELTHSELLSCGDFAERIPTATATNTREMSNKNSKFILWGHGLFVIRSDISVIFRP